MFHENHELAPIIAGHHYLIAIDGAAKNNPGPGGWGLVKQLKDSDQIVRQLADAGHSSSTICGRITTNNKMEMYAATKAIQGIFEPDTPAIIMTDSQLVHKGMTEWLPRWKASGWKGSDGPVKNRDLWERLDAACEGKTIHWLWVKGHAGHELNEIADTLASNAALGRYPKGRQSVKTIHPEWFIG